MGKKMKEIELLNCMRGIGIYVIRQDDHSILYYNQRVKEVAPQVRLGARCDEIFAGSCSTCPLLCMEGKDTYTTISYNDPFGETVDITANRMTWGEEVPAFLITVSAHKMTEAEEKALTERKHLIRAVQEMYAMIISVNLTENTYYLIEHAKFISGSQMREGCYDNLFAWSRSITHPDDREEYSRKLARENLLECFEEGAAEQYAEVRQKGEDGIYHWMAVHIVRADNDQGGDTTVLILGRLIDGKKKMEQEIEEVSRREEWYRTAVETGEDVLFEYDSEKDVFTSYELLEKEGRRTAFRKEFANYEYHLTHSDMVYPDDVELVRKIICRGEFVPAEIRMHTPWDGDDYVWYYVRGRAYKKTNGYIRVVGTLRNIDKTKKQEEQYILLRDRFSIAVRNTYDRVLEVNYKKNEVYSLELSERGLDKVRCSATAGEFMDYFINHRLHPSQRASFREYEQNADKYLREGSIYDEWQVLGEDGQYHWEGIYCLASEWEEGTYLNFVKNIDEVKKKEEQARRNLKDALASAEQANMAKRDFLSRMSHDIRTPMNAIVGMVAIAASHIEEKQQVQDCLAKITVSAKHLIGLINDILDMSRIESGKMMLNEENFNIAEQIQDLIVIIQPQIKEKGQELEVSLGTIRSENLIGDTLRVQQLLLNIVSNAVKYTAEGGKITICINELECRYSDTAKFEISVEDNGIGMTEEFQRRLFQPFEQEKTEYLGKVQGTGLGMAITKNIVDMMNGTIEVKSTPGKGSKFTVTLFFKKQEKSAGEYGDELEGLRALVVDDDLDVCESTCAILEELGMDSEWVQTGREAVNRVILAQEAQRSYNTVLVDWQMPEMNGLETAAAIRSRLGDEIPIIIITAYDWSDIEEEARRAGVTAFIPKPLFKSNLYRTIRDWNGYRQNEVRPMLTEKEVYEGRRFLLVEDNELNREIGRELLEITGAQVDCAANGREAVDMLQQAEPGTYDIVLMDIQMPVMNGYEAAEHIRNSGRKDLETLPIFAMTANAFTEDIQRARRAGMNEHLAKPLDINYLYRILQKYLENPGTLI